MPSLTRRRILLASAGCGGLLAAGAWSATQSSSLALVERTRFALGTQVQIVAVHKREATASQAIEAAFAELELVEQLMSVYRPDSQLSRLNRDGVLDDPHPHLVEVLRFAQEISRRSGGESRFRRGKSGCGARGRRSRSTASARDSPLIGCSPCWPRAASSTP